MFAHDGELSYSTLVDVLVTSISIAFEVTCNCFAVSW